MEKLLNMQKYKLIKHEVDYYCLLNDEGEVIADVNGGDILKLSLKNCQAIGRGYDLDELAEEEVKLHHTLSPKAFKRGVEIGFRKALEILGDKKFTEEDVRCAMDRVWDWYNDEEDVECPSIKDLKNKHIQSLQQNEWEVEIVMESIGRVKVGAGSKTEQMMPKLDADGCLKLKRV